MSDAPRLSPADHVLIHAVGVLICDGLPDDSDDMVLSILRDVLPDANRTIPQLRPFIGLAEEILRQPGIPSVRAMGRVRMNMQVLRDWHKRRMAGAWDLIRESYPNV